MCGLIFVKRKDGIPAKKMLAKRYTAQKTRGSDGYGYVAILDGVALETKRSTTEKEIETQLDKETAPAILFHHRMPTSTPNYVEATHPIEVKNKILDYDYFVIHNGIISNDTELRTKHKELGFDYTTIIRKKVTTRLTSYQWKVWNDSEAFAVELALAIEKRKPTIEAEGSIAFIALQAEKKTGKVLAVYYGRNYGNPLKLETQKDFLCLASEGNGELVESDTLFRLDYLTGITTSEKMSIGKYTAYQTTGYGRGYDDYDPRDYASETTRPYASQFQNELPLPRTKELSRRNKDGVMIYAGDQDGTDEIDDEDYDEEVVREDLEVLEIEFAKVEVLFNSAVEEKENAKAEILYNNLEKLQDEIDYCKYWLNTHEANQAITP